MLTEAEEDQILELILGLVQRCRRERFKWGSTARRSARPRRRFQSGTTASRSHHPLLKLQWGSTARRSAVPRRSLQLGTTARRSTNHLRIRAAPLVGRNGNQKKRTLPTTDGISDPIKERSHASDILTDNQQEKIISHQEAAPVLKAMVPGRHLIVGGSCGTPWFHAWSPVPAMELDLNKASSDWPLVPDRYCMKQVYSF